MRKHIAKDKYYQFIDSDEIAEASTQAVKDFYNKFPEYDLTDLAHFLISAALYQAAYIELNGRN